MRRAIARRWGVIWGSWWMVTWALDGTFSIGLHLDPRTRPGPGGPYGPYADLHLGPLSVSLGRQPARAWNHSLMRPELSHADGHEGGERP